MGTETPIVITKDVGAVKVGDTVLPGLFQRMEVHRALAMDEAAVPGRSGKSKQPLGFEDADVELSVLCQEDEASTAEAKLRTIVSLFQTQDKLARPFVYEITHRLLAVWGIRKVLFHDLRTEEDNESDNLIAVLSFREHEPVTLKAEKRRPKPVVAAAAGGVTVFDAFGQGYSVPGSVNVFQEDVTQDSRGVLSQVAARVAATEQQLAPAFASQGATAPARSTKDAELSNLSPAVDDDRYGGAGGVE